MAHDPMGRVKPRYCLPAPPRKGATEEEAAQIRHIIEAKIKAWDAWDEACRSIRHIHALYCLVGLLLFVGFAFGSIAYYLYSVR
jgi:hypothetical protein